MVVLFFCILEAGRDKRVSVSLFTHNGEPNLNSKQHTAYSWPDQIHISTDVCGVQLVLWNGIFTV